MTAVRRRGSVRARASRLRRCRRAPSASGSCGGRGTTRTRLPAPTRAPCCMPRRSRDVRTARRTRRGRSLRPARATRGHGCGRPPRSGRAGSSRAFGGPRARRPAHPRATAPARGAAGRRKAARVPLGDLHLGDATARTCATAGARSAGARITRPCQIAVVRASPRPVHKRSGERERRAGDENLAVRAMLGSAH